MGGRSTRRSDAARRVGVHGHRLAFVVTAAWLAAACLPSTGEPSVGVPSAAPSASAASAGPSDPSVPPGTVTSVSSGDAVELSVGDGAEVLETGVSFTVLAASGPADGCTDCPNQVDLQVDCPPARDELHIAFSGGMSEEALDRARRGLACGLEFFIVEVHDGRATVRVGPPT